MVLNGNRLIRISVTFLIMVGTVFEMGACAPQSTNGQAFNATDVQQTLGALQAELNQTATAEKNGFILQATSVAQTQTAAVTPLPTRTITPTPDVQKTQQMSGVLQKIQQYANDKYLPSTAGTYQRLNDQTFNFADAGNYKWKDVGINLDDFAYESDVSWENATVPAKDIVSGCGFIFHSDGDKNYSMAYIGLDGNAYMVSVSDGKPLLLGSAPFGKVDASKGNTHIALLVSGTQYTLLVNEKMVLQKNSTSGALKTGEFAYAVYSGSSERLGTTCKFTNIDLWTVKSSN